jgi:hypothetical protein
MITKRLLWETPLRGVAQKRKTSQEAWHGQVLSQEIHDLSIMVRSLEFNLGFLEGRSVGRVENVLVNKLNDAEPGAAVVAANPGTHH